MIVRIESSRNVMKNQRISLINHAEEKKFQIRILNKAGILETANSYLNATKGHIFIRISKWSTEKGYAWIEGKIFFPHVNGKFMP